MAVYIQKNSRLAVSAYKQFSNFVYYVSHHFVLINFKKTLEKKQQ